MTSPGFWLALLSLIAVTGALLVVFFERKADRLQRELQRELRAAAEERRRALEETSTLRGVNQTLQTDNGEWQARATVAERENQALARFRGLPDVEREAQRLVTEAQHAATRTREDVAQFEARMRAAAEREVAEASARAEALVEKARAEAKETASEAMEVKNSLEDLQRQAKALKNVIEGYGDAYIIPTHSLLDDLARDFGHTDAGEQLKKARERTRKMIKEEQAADCDYAEANRRETAITFVVDAFNGKVDSILARVKADNFGTLQQEIRDASTLVNKNGSAFRNARIVAPYLEARIDELRWAAAAHELKNQEREEQRAIKERIREEEKARKEYERAMREAAKEEDALKDAMERIQQEVAKASEAQRAHYELQLQELAGKLAAAEEKNQRALSMAQQTKAGNVYVISNVGSFGEEVFKIGLTRRLDPLDRIRELGDASVPFEFDVHAMIRSDDAPALEHELHRHFLASQINKVNPRKEFFRVSLAVIRQEIEKLGITASWTMTAAAAQYRESLAIDQAIRNNPASFQAWRDKQLVLDARAERQDEELAEAS